MQDKQHFHAPSKCPVCAQPIAITKLKCMSCQTELTGEFSPCRFCTLDEKNMLFIETFLRCRGSIKEVERALGVSYPTVKNMMETALQALGLEGKKTESIQETQRDAILEKLSAKEIDVATAIKELEKLKGDQ